MGDYREMCGLFWLQILAVSVLRRVLRLAVRLACVSSLFARHLQKKYLNKVYIHIDYVKTYYCRML